MLSQVQHSPGLRMNVALRIGSESLLGEPGSSQETGQIARVQIFDACNSVEPVWRHLERNGAIKTPYQSFDLLSSWQRHIGSKTGVTPFIVAGFDSAGEAAFLWPLGRASAGPVNILSFLGGKHANFNFALWRRDLVDSITADDIGTVLTQIAATRKADILSLLRQPCSWEGFVNPFSRLPHQASPSGSLRLTITERGEEQLKQMLSSAARRKLRAKERKLRTLAGYRYVQATTPADVSRFLDAFFPLKSAHMKAQALPNIFAAPCQQSFLRDACLIGLADGSPLIEIHAIEADSELLALFAAINDGKRASGMFNTYTLSGNAKQSPGLVLLTNLISSLADRGVGGFDLGVGEASYKAVFCKEPEPLFDSFLPLTPLGKLAAVAASTGCHVKRQIKQNNSLRNLVQFLRQGFASRQS